MTSRSATLAMSVVLVAVIGVSTAAVGFLLALAGGGVAGIEPGGAARAVLPALAVVLLVAGVASLGSAAGLWLGRPWAWAASLAVSVLAVAGAVVALGTSGVQLPLVMGLVLTVAATVLVLAPSTRSAVGVS